MRNFILTLRVPRKKSLRLILVAPYGPSCVGKSTAMRYLAKHLPLVHIQHDHIRLFFRARGIDENKYLYKYHPLERTGERFLKKGYSVILDANFATNHTHVPAAKKLAKKYNAKFFLVRVVAPKSYIIKKLKAKKFLPLEKGGLLPSAEVAIAHFLRSLKEFNYEWLKKETSVVVNSSKPLKPQLKNTIDLLKKKYN